MHLGIVLSDLAALETGPDHEGVHGPFDVISQSCVGGCRVVLCGCYHQMRMLLMMNGRIGQLVVDLMGQVVRMVTHGRVLHDRLHVHVEASKQTKITRNKIVALQLSRGRRSRLRVARRLAFTRTDTDTFPYGGWAGLADPTGADWPSARTINVRWAELQQKLPTNCWSLFFLDKEKKKKPLLASFLVSYDRQHHKLQHKEARHVQEMSRDLFEWLLTEKHEKRVP